MHGTTVKIVKISLYYTILNTVFGVKRISNNDRAPNAELHNTIFYDNFR